MKRFIMAIMSFAVALFSAFACVGCSASTKTLVVGITDYEPMDYKESDGGEWIGFDADLARAFGKEYGYNVKFQEIEWGSKVMEINSGAIDLIWNGMTATEDLKSSLSLSLSYAKNYQCVVVKTSNLSAVSDVESLKSVSVAVEEGSAGDEAVTEAGITPNRVVSQINTLTEVKAGTSVAAVIDYTMAASVIGKGSYTDLSIVPGIEFGAEVFAVGAKKNSPLTAKLNEFFKAKYADGTLASLAAQYGVAINEDAFKN